MTVSDLIAALSLLPLDLPVCVPGTGMDEGSYVPPRNIKIMDLWEDERSPGKFGLFRCFIDSKPAKVVVLEESEV